jgi:hypothetical protein
MTKARTAGQKRRGRPRKDGPPVIHPDTPPPPTMAPTPEARQHGRYARGDGPRAPFVNYGSTLLGKMAWAKSITTRQRNGGEAFAATHRLAWGSSTRDSTQPTIGGVSHETEAQAARMVARRGKLNAVLNRCGPAAYAVLVQVAVYEQALGRSRGVALPRYDALRAGLDACAAEFDVGE